MNNWLKSYQSVGRGLRPGEITVLKSRQCGKSMILDLETDFNSWTHVLQPHYVEMVTENGTEWFRYSKKPSISVICAANKVIRRNEDGSFEYIKNRAGTGLYVLNVEEEKEMAWIILKAKHIV